MKLIRHGESIVALVERSWEKAFLTACQHQREWEPLFLAGSVIPFAEIHTVTHSVRLGEGQQMGEQCEVFLHE